MRSILDGSILDVGYLIGVDVAPDGMSVNLHVSDCADQGATISLPTDALNSLIITLPALLNEAMRRRHGNDSLRLAYPMGSYQVERAAGRDAYILTLGTIDGFAISFTMSITALNDIAHCANEDMRRKCGLDDDGTADAAFPSRLN